MLRTFRTHTIRKQQELDGLWGFKALEGPLLGKRQRAMVPGCWENMPGYENYRGTAEYETRFTTCGGHGRLEFKGVSHTAQVFVDGAPVGGHYGAYTPFAVTLPGLKAGSHSLRVVVDNSFGPATAINRPNDYHSYGGISRPVALEELADCFIEAVHLTPGQSGRVWTLDVAVRVKNLSARERTVEIQGKTGKYGHELGKRTLAAGETAVFKGRLACPDVRAYEPDAPMLYLYEATLLLEGEAADDMAERFGFREVKVSGKDILFNGKPIKIKGFNRHEDHPMFGCALPAAAMQQDIALMKAMGANAVRTSHYPNDEVFLDLCDEQGLLVWEENHARGLSEEEMRHPAFEEQCEACIREMVSNHFNHPAIFIWGILNECASDTAYGRQCYKSQLELLRKLDPSRPVSFASCRFMTDICLDLVDVVSYNCYPLWYEDVPPERFIGDLYAWAQNAGGGGKPFLVTEIGAGAVYGNRSPIKLKWSEERQAEILDAQLNEALANPNYAGVFIWQYCDIRVSEEWFNNRPKSQNNKGIVDMYRRPKLAWATVQKQFGKNRR